jgi:hypothetical protein
VQQLRETFPDAAPYRYDILDHDSVFNGDVIAFLAATGLRLDEMQLATDSGKRADFRDRVAR